MTEREMETRVERIIEGMKSISGGTGAEKEKVYEKMIRSEAPADAGDVYEMIRIVSERLTGEPKNNEEEYEKRYPKGWRPENFRELSEAMKSGWTPGDDSGGAEADAKVTARDIEDGSLTEEELLVILIWQLVRILGESVGETVQTPAYSEGDSELTDGNEIEIGPELRKLIPALRYKADIDTGTCETCRFLNGRTFRVTHIIWKVIKPKLHLNCRCASVPLTASSSFRMDDPDETLRRLKRLEIKDIMQNRIPKRLRALGLIG